MWSHPSAQPHGAGDGLLLPQLPPAAKLMAISQLSWSCSLQASGNDFIPYLCCFCELDWFNWAFPEAGDGGGWPEPLPLCKAPTPGSAAERAHRIRRQQSQFRSHCCQKGPSSHQPPPAPQGLPSHPSGRFSNSNCGARSRKVWGLGTFFFLKG